jgi:TfuA protein
MRRNRICVFGGPSLCGLVLPPGIDLFPPATRGAVSAALRAGYTHIGFVDGALAEDERVPLRELREALATPGVHLWGSSSMGAIRAVQLQTLGMRGVGRIFRLLRRGSLPHSDEVYVLHAPARLRYRCLTEPLVNLRYTFRAMRHARHLTRAEEHALVQYMRDVPWFDRDRQSLRAAVYALCGSARSARFMQAFDSLYRNVKAEDASALVSLLLNMTSRAVEERPQMGGPVHSCRVTNEAPPRARIVPRRPLP